MAARDDGDQDGDDVVLVDDPQHESEIMGRLAALPEWVLGESMLGSLIANSKDKSIS